MGLADPPRLTDLGCNNICAVVISRAFPCIYWRHLPANSDGTFWVHFLRGYFTTNWLHFRVWDLMLCSCFSDQRLCNTALLCYPSWEKSLSDSIRTEVYQINKLDKSSENQSELGMFVCEYLYLNRHTKHKSDLYFRKLICKFVLE